VVPSAVSNGLGAAPWCGGLRGLGLGLELARRRVGAGEDDGLGEVAEDEGHGAGRVGHGTRRRGVTPPPNGPPLTSP